MADSGPPRIARMQQAGGRLKILHPRNVGGGMHMGGGAGARPAGGGGLAQSFGGGGGGVRESGDPAVSGNFEHTGTVRAFGFPIAGGNLTEKGQRDKDDNDLLTAGRKAYAQAKFQGASDQMAATAAVRQGGPDLLAAMQGHPDNPLSSVPAFHKFLSDQGDQPRQTQIKGGDGKVYNVNVNPDGSISNPQDVGLPGPQAKTSLVNTQQGMGRLGPTGDIVPVLDANGMRAQAPLSAAQVKAQQSGGQAGPVRATTQGQTQELTNINTVLENVNKMRNSASASGSLGWGSVNRLIAEKTPLSGPVAEAYNEAYNQMRPALLALTRTPGQQAKAYAAGMLDQLPDPAHANLFNVNQVLPSIQLQMRERLGMLVQNYAPGADNRPGAYTQAVSLAKTYDAHPVKMQDLQAARAQLQQNPAALSNEQVALLKSEADNNHLAYDDWTRVERQGLQRGMINTSDYGKLVASNPDLANIPQNEVLQDPSLKKQVPQDRSQAAQQAPALPPQSVTTQAPQAPPAPQEQQVPQTPQARGRGTPPPQQPDTSAAGTDASAGVQGSPPAGPQQPVEQQATPAAPQGASAPIPPAQQPLAQPTPGQASGVPPQAGGSQALAPSPQTPMTPLSAETMKLLHDNNVPTDAIEQQQD